MLLITNGYELTCASRSIYLALNLIVNRYRRDGAKKHKEEQEQFQRNKARWDLHKQRTQQFKMLSGGGTNDKRYWINWGSININESMSNVRTESRTNNNEWANKNENLSWKIDDTFIRRRQHSIYWEPTSKIESDNTEIKEWKSDKTWIKEMITINTKINKNNKSTKINKKITNDPE